MSPGSATVDRSGNTPAFAPEHLALFRSFVHEHIAHSTWMDAGHELAEVLRAVSA